jgi:hypothetical protein
VDILVLKLRCNERRKINTSLVEEEGPFLNTYMSRREQNSWSWISRTLKPEVTVLAKVKVKISLLQAVEASRVERGRGSHIT